MVLAVEWGKQEGLITKEAVWYKEKWKRGMVLENKCRRLRWDYEFKTRTYTAHNRPDLVLEYLDKKEMFIIDQACPKDDDVDNKEREKRIKYQQLAFEIRTQLPGWKVKVIPSVIGCLGNISSLVHSIRMVIHRKSALSVVAEMQRTVVTNSETIIRNIKSGIVVTT